MNSDPFKEQLGEVSVARIEVVNSSKSDRTVDGV